ncbi:MAG: SsrA-binding protein [Patescibacteria group bacterium]
MNLARNKKAHFDYHILESYQAGLSISGKMVKQLRQKRVNITGKYIIYQKLQLQIIDFGNDKLRENVPLLLNKKEQAEISSRLNEKGISCVVLNIYTLGRWIKAEIAIVRGKKNFDKRESIKKRDLEREEARNLL